MTLYRCQKCGITYSHDAAYRHAVYLCKERHR